MTMILVDENPCFRAFMDEMALPSGVRGPVKFVKADILIFLCWLKWADCAARFQASRGYVKRRKL